MENSSEFVGTLDDVYQEADLNEIPIPTVPVKQDGPVEVHILPSVNGGSRSFVLAIDEAKRVGNEDPRRRSLTLIADQAFLIGSDANEVVSNYGARWPANVPCVITHRDAVYVKLLVAGTMSVLTENWAS